MRLDGQMTPARPGQRAAGFRVPVPPEQRCPVARGGPPAFVPAHGLEAGSGPGAAVGNLKSAGHALMTGGFPGGRPLRSAGLDDGGHTPQRRQPDSEPERAPAMEEPAVAAARWRPSDCRL